MKIIFYAVVINIALTTMIDRFKHPEYTETQLLLNLPNSFVWDFK